MAANLKLAALSRLHNGLLVTDRNVGMIGRISESGKVILLRSLTGLLPAFFFFFILPAFSGLMLFFIMRHIITFEFLLLALATVKVILVFSAMLFCVEPDVMLL